LSFDGLSGHQYRETRGAKSTVHVRSAFDVVGVVVTVVVTVVIVTVTVTVVIRNVHIIDGSRNSHSIRAFTLVHEVIKLTKKPNK